MLETLVLAAAYIYLKIVAAAVCLMVSLVVGPAVAFLAWLWSWVPLEVCGE